MFKYDKNRCKDKNHQKNQNLARENELKEIKVCDVSQEKIACINLAYANGQLIKTLIERTNVLNRGKMDRLNDIEGKINKLCFDKQEEFMRPVTAFITF